MPKSKPSEVEMVAIALYTGAMFDKDHVDDAIAFWQGEMALHPKNLYRVRARELIRALRGAE